MNTLIISSSLSKSSKSLILAKEVKKRIEEFTDVTFIDLKEFDLKLTHKTKSDDMIELSSLVEKADNIIFATGIYNYSISDSLKVFVDTCLNKENSKGKFYGILCAAGSEMSYLSFMHLTQMCQNHNKMIQLPDIVFATGKDFIDNEIQSENLFDRIDYFCSRFLEIGNKLL